MAAHPRFSTRPIEPGDIGAVAALLEAYMAETYGDTWHGTPERFAHDIGDRLGVEVAVSRDGKVIGFLAWTRSYDLHHCVTGTDVLDLYVVPAARGLGVALALVCAVAARSMVSGGIYLKGTAVARGSGKRLYDRFAHCSSTQDCIVGGRAFRHLTTLAGRSAREMATDLPLAAWNYEP